MRHKACPTGESNLRPLGYKTNSVPITLHSACESSGEK
uniref:Uncharacterized protein n=1 Tax=Anguilla anguilla TaxID=7936 RepID=A0A0E9QF77_ANGAN